MVCCVLAAALLAGLGRFVRRLTGRDGTPRGSRPPAPVARTVVGAGPAEAPVLVDA